VFGTGHTENIRRDKGADLEQIGKRWEYFEETYGWFGEGQQQYPIGIVLYFKGKEKQGGKWTGYLWHVERCRQ
jgi:hypothetical protein